MRYIKKKKKVNRSEMNDSDRVRRGKRIYKTFKKCRNSFFFFFSFSFLLFYMLSPHYEMKPDIGRHSTTNGIRLHLCIILPTQEFQFL